MKCSLFLILFTCLVMAGCHHADKTTSPDQTKPDSSITAPIKALPIKGVDVPYKEYIVDAAKGDTLFYPSGSTIIVPPNAFIDKDSNIIKGNTVVKYREFKDPMDIYLAGISMNYDSAGQHFSLQSAGMCEILAFKDGVPVFVNPKSQPGVNIVTNDTSGAYNIYYMDTIRHNWSYQSSSPVTIPNKLKKVAVDISPADTDLVQPVKPQKMTNRSPVIRIDIDPGPFKELAAYNNLRMQLEDGGKTFNPKDTSEQWNSIRLNKTRVNGLYTVTFSNANRIVTYDARPVLDEKDYDEALKVYGKNNVAYKKHLRQKLEARKQKIDALNARFDSFADTLAIRILPITRFGIWNCDRYLGRNLGTVMAVFKDDNGNIITLKNIAVMYRPPFSITAFIDNNIQVAFNKSTDYMVIGSYQGRLAYISYSDCKNIEIRAKSEIVYPMTVVPEKDNNYQFLKEIYKRF